MKVNKVDFVNLRDLYNKNVNIVNHLKTNFPDMSLEKVIEISYDLQSGSYTQIEKDSDQTKNSREYSSDLLVSYLNKLKFNTICEVGVGEANGLLNICKKINFTKAYGFDISLSRLLYANKNMLDNFSEDKFSLFNSDLFNIPLPDNSIDVVYTAHSIEPNGGKEKEALQELYRVCKKYLILREPDFENASEEGKKRMKYHGYATIDNLIIEANKLGMKIITKEFLGNVTNILNPSSLIIIEKDDDKLKAKQEDLIFTCPISNYPLKRGDNFLYSDVGGYLYPIIKDIPVLIRDKGMLSSHISEFI